MKHELETTYTVRISDCDVGGHFRTSTLVKELLELGEDQAALFNLDRRTLLEKGVCWVLYRQAGAIRRQLTFGDQLTAVTWPGEISGPVFPRYFALFDQQGAAIGEGVTSWVLMDVNTRRPLRPSVLPGVLPVSDARPPSMPLPGMLRMENAAPIGQRTVVYSDLDVNGHMNNARYIDWVLDTQDASAIAARGVSAWQLNYITEAKLGEVLELYAQPDGSAVLTQGKRASDGRVVFEARTVVG